MPVDLKEEEKMPLWKQILWALMFFVMLVLGINGWFMENIK